MIVKKLLELPSVIIYEGIYFELKLEWDTPDRLVLVYQIQDVKDESKHSELYERYGCWKNCFLDNVYTGFLWYTQFIKTDEDLIEAIELCKEFLNDKKLL